MLRSLQIIVVLVALGVIGYSAFWSWSSAIDFPQYYIAARMYVAGDAKSIYNAGKLAVLEHEAFPQMPKRHEAFLDLPFDPAPIWYPPYAIPLFAWLAVLPPLVAMGVWTVLGLAAFVAALMVLGRTYSVSRSALLWVFALVAISGPFDQAVILGQPVFIILFGLSAAIYALKNNKPALAVIGLSLMIPKPQLALPVLAFLFGAKRYKVIFAVMGCGIALVLLSLATESWDTYSGYLQAMKFATEHPIVMGMHGCLTIRSQLMRLFPQAWDIVSPVTTVLYAATLAFIVFAGRKVSHLESWLEIGLIGLIPIGLVAAPYFHPYDLLILLPSMFAFATAKFEVRMRHERGILVGLFVVFFTFIVYTSIYFCKSAVNAHLFCFLTYIVVAWIDLIRNRESEYMTCAK